MFELSAEEWMAVNLSLRIAVTATIASLPFGIFAAYALARWRFPGNVRNTVRTELLIVLTPQVLINGVAMPTTNTTLARS